MLEGGGRVVGKVLHISRTGTVSLSVQSFIESRGCDLCGWFQGFPHTTTENWSQFIVHHLAVSFCCIPTPLTLANRSYRLWFTMLLIWQVVHSVRRGLSINPGVTTLCVCGCSLKDEVFRLCGCYIEGIVVMDMIWHQLCTHDLGKGVLSWAMVRQVRRGSISSELIMCNGCVRSIW